MGRRSGRARKKGWPGRFRVREPSQRGSARKKPVRRRGRRRSLGVERAAAVAFEGTQRIAGRGFGSSALRGRPSREMAPNAALRGRVAARSALRPSAQAAGPISRGVASSCVSGAREIACEASLMNARDLATRLSDLRRREHEAMAEFLVAPGCECESASRAASSFSSRRFGTVRCMRNRSPVSGSNGAPRGRTSGAFTGCAGVLASRRSAGQPVAVALGSDCADAASLPVPRPQSRDAFPRGALTRRSYRADPRCGES
jgi:hypothetical protein